MTRPFWLGRAVRNRHRHAIEQASRRWRGGRRDDSARTRRKILISARARKAHPPPPPPPAPAPTEADLAFAEAVAAAERLPKPPFDPYDVVGLDGDGHSTGADFERAFEEDMRKRAAAASEDEQSGVFVTFFSGSS